MSPTVEELEQAINVILNTELSEVDADMSFPEQLELDRKLGLARRQLDRILAA